MVHNVNCTKKSQMIKPTDLIKLPQDENYNKIGSAPKSTRKQFEEFQQLANSKLNKK
jgi:hypothetical protein